MSAEQEADSYPDPCYWAVDACDGCEEHQPHVRLQFDELTEDGVTSVVKLFWPKDAIELGNALIRAGTDMQ